MKNIFKLYGVIVLAMIIGFSIIACDDDSGGNDTPTTTPTTPTMPTTPTTFSLDGVWARDDGTIISVFDGKAVFSDILANSAWKEVEKKGNMKIGDSYWRNITKTGDLTWKYENLTFNTSTYAIIGWSAGTITMNSNGQTLNVNVPNTTDPNHSFIKR